VTSSSFIATPLFCLLLGVVSLLNYLRWRDRPRWVLALTVVQRRMQRPGGRIWARSVSDRGATYCFTLGPPAGPTLSEATI
jgi:hypothetical protein